MTKERDAFQKIVLRYEVIIIAVVLLFVAGKYFLPHFPFLKGWEQKFTQAAIETGKENTPPDMQHISDPGDIAKLSKNELPPEITNLNGPILIGGWKCKVLKEEGVCFRYLWEGEPMTLVIAFKEKKPHKSKGAFTKTGWGGYFIIQDTFSAALVGPFLPEHLQEIWPFTKSY